jgi:C4-dicarboxylate transporter DctM subunit
VIVLFGMSLPASWSYVSFMKVEKSSTWASAWTCHVLDLPRLRGGRHRALPAPAGARPRAQGRRRRFATRVCELHQPVLPGAGVIVALSLLGVPVGHAMIGGSVLYLYLKGMDMGAAAEQLLNGTYSSFLLLAIPLFILAATIMSSGSILDRLLRFCNAWWGASPAAWRRSTCCRASCLPACRVGTGRRGRLGQADAVHDDAGRQVHAGLCRGAQRRVVGHRTDPAAVDPAGAVCAGVRHVDRLPVHRRRVAGPAAGAVQMALIYVLAKRRGFPLEPRVPLRDMPRITREAFPALMLPVILLGCLYSGITTPTEAAGVAAAYALLICRPACTAACAGATVPRRCCPARA